MGHRMQCDEIGRFNGLWQLFKAFGNNKFAPHYKAIFVKVSKSIIFIVISIDIWRFFLVTLTELHVLFKTEFSHHVLL